MMVTGSSCSHTDVKVSYNDESLHSCNQVGNWLLSLSSDNAEEIQQSSEYQEFVQLVAKIQLARRSLELFSRNDSIVVDDKDKKKSSFLQCSSAEDIILKIFEFLDSKDLVQTMKSCSRLYLLGQQSARLRTRNLAISRQLDGVMQLLRAQEQIQGIRTTVDEKYVRIPMLLLSRRVVVTNARDTEYNGVYFCTGTNGNGFVFTKPRYLEGRLNRVYIASSSRGDPSNSDVDNPDEDEVTKPCHLLRCIIAKRFSDEVRSIEH